eukprot:987532-Amphidinium_carterae.1
MHVSHWQRVAVSCAEASEKFERETDEMDNTREQWKGFSKICCKNIGQRLRQMSSDQAMLQSNTSARYCFGFKG